MGEVLTRLGGIEGAEVMPDEPLAAHTTLRVGGPARALVRVDTVEALRAVAAVCRRERLPWLVLGRGSNLLVADDGWPGVALVLGRGFREFVVDGARVEAGGAEPMPVLADKVARAGLGGLAFGVAIPGTLGGAVRMNAGAHGHELAEVLEAVEVVRLDSGRVQRIDAGALEMSYRHSALPSDAIVVRGWLGLRPTDAETLRAEMDEMRRWRRAHQPINSPSCGSVFRNPPGDSAGRLVEAAGMKGHRVGAAQVSELHANFITTSPGASAADVHRLIADIRSAVAERFDVMLSTEVVLAGFDEEEQP